MEIINCYHNNQTPYIATASRDDLTTIGDKSLRYPIVHATLNSCEVFDEILGTKKHLSFIQFQDIRNSSNSEELVKKVRSELLKFLVEEYKNSFYYFIDGEFCKISDIKNKFMLLPLKLKKVKV